MSTLPSIEPATAARVLQALENPKYVWRTVSGLEKETMLPRKTIVTSIRRIPKDELIVSRGAKGERLYSTRSHYGKKQSFVGKLLGVLAGRAI